MKRLLVAVLGFFVAACGGDNNSTPAAPTPPPTPTVSTLTINGLDAIRTGFFSDFTATATLSNGTTQTVTPTWSSSNPGLASVDGTGRVRGVGHGAVAVTASYEGRTASKNVSIVNNYGGQWNGSYVIRACDASGAFRSADWCRGEVGRTYQLVLSLTQTGNDRSQIAGTLDNQYARNARVTGTVTSDGRLVLSTNTTLTGDGFTFRFELGGWDTNLTAPNQMSGRTAVNLTAINISGNAYEEHTITTVTNTNPSSMESLPER